MKARTDVSALFGFLILIMLIVVATTAFIMYKNPDTQAIILWGSVGVIVLFIIGLLFFGGVKMPSARTGVRLVIIAPKTI